MAIRNAISRGVIEGKKVGREYVVFPNKKFTAWQPNPVRQKIGRESQQR